MLKIQRAVNGEVVFTLSGRMDAENVVELKTLFGSEAEGRRIVLDLNRGQVRTNLLVWLPAVWGGHSHTRESL
jgi:hypothetical protein